MAREGYLPLAGKLFAGDTVLSKRPWAEMGNFTQNTPRLKWVKGKEVGNGSRSHGKAAEGKWKSAAFVKTTERQEGPGSESQKQQK